MITVTEWNYLNFEAKFLSHSRGEFEIQYYVCFSTFINLWKGINNSLILLVICYIISLLFFYKNGFGIK